MKIKFVVIGKTDESYLQTGITKYLERLKHYIVFEYKVIPDLKNNRKMTQEQQKLKEGELILLQIEKSDFVILLDENGKDYSSRKFSEFLEKQMIAGRKCVTFVVGGPYGFSSEVYDRADSKLGLSKMTFSHQMVRLIFVEQLYRAFTIIKGEPYHHD